MSLFIADNDCDGQFKRTKSQVEVGGDLDQYKVMCAQFMQTSHLNDSTLDQIHDLDQEFGHLFKTDAVKEGKENEKSGQIVFANSTKNDDSKKFNFKKSDDKNCMVKDKKEIVKNKKIIKVISKS